MPTIGIVRIRPFKPTNKMGEAKEVKLYGSWASGYCTMVHAALKIKGVDYEYVEEDLANKSEALLRLNPVYKKVPVLVVDGKPIAESLVILQFVDETWKEPAILPKDPYLKAKARFWADFIYQKLAPTSYAIMQSEGEAQEKAKKEAIEHLITLEEGIFKDFPNKGPFINGEEPGLIDIILGASSTGMEVLGTLAGTDLLEKTPRLSSAAKAFAEYEVAKDTIIPYDKLLGHLQARKAAA